MRVCVACVRMPARIYEERRPSPASSARISSASRPVAVWKAGSSGPPGPQRGCRALPLQALTPLAFLRPENSSWCGGWELGVPSPVPRATVAWEAEGGLSIARSPPQLYQPLVTFAGSLTRRVPTSTLPSLRPVPGGIPITVLLSYPTSKPLASLVGFIFKTCPESSHFSPTLCHHLSEPS